MSSNGADRRELKSAMEIPPPVAAPSHRQESSLLSQARRSCMSLTTGSAANGNDALMTSLRLPRGAAFQELVAGRDVEALDVGVLVREETRWHDPFVAT